MLDGEKIIVGGEEMVMPPLNIKAVKKFYKQLQQGLDPSQSVEVVTEIIYEALARNYPDLTTEQLEERLSLPEMNEVLPKLLEVSGFVAAVPQTGAPKKKSRTGTPLSAA